MIQKENEKYGEQKRRISLTRNKEKNKNRANRREERKKQKNDKKQYQ